MLSKEVIMDLLGDSPCTKNGWSDDSEGHWCFIRRLISSSGLNSREAYQLRLIYDYKLMKSREEGRDIGEQRAETEFIKGYAPKFAEVYRDGMRRYELFEKVFGVKLPSAA